MIKQSLRKDISLIHNATNIEFIGGSRWLEQISFEMDGKYHITYFCNVSAIFTEDEHVETCTNFISKLMNPLRFLKIVSRMGLDMPDELKLRAAMEELAGETK